MRVSLSRLILFALVGVFFAQASFYYPNLPEFVGTHFDQLGRSNNLMPKRMFITFEAALLILIVLEAIAIPFIVERMPRRFINVPNRHYWLSDEMASVAFSKIKGMFEALGVILVLFFIVLNQILFRSNVLQQNVDMIVLVAAVSCFFCAMIAWFIGFSRAFRIPQKL